MTKDQQIPISKIIILYTELEDIKRRIDEINAQKVHGGKMFLIYRLCLITLKNIFDLLKEGTLGLTLDLNNDKTLNKKKKELIKNLKVYNNQRNQIIGHLEKVVFQKLITKVNIEALMGLGKECCGEILMRELINESINFKNTSYIYDLSNSKDLEKIGKDLAKSIYASQKFFDLVLQKLNFKTE